MAASIEKEIEEIIDELEETTFLDPKIRSLKLEGRWCVYCSEENARFSCGECIAIGVDTWYCSLRHKKKDKKTHKEFSCKSFNVKSNDHMGRYLMASRFIDKGDLIMKEKPLFLGPIKNIPPVCLACCKSVNGSYRCSKCSWPMCDKKCEDDPLHVPECKTSREQNIGKVILNFSAEHPFYNYILPLRILYARDHDPKKYELILNMESHIIARKNSGHDITGLEMKKLFKLSEFSEEEVMHACGVTIVNCYKFRNSNLCGIYQNASLLAHSCLPNAFISFNEKRELVLRASIDIEEDVPICISYCNLELGTQVRQALLQRSKYFLCSCDRCLDPTEMGTYMSSPLCQKCGIGNVVPSIRRAFAVWTCKRCGHSVENKYVSELTEAYREQLYAIKLSKEYEKFLDDTRTVLSRNHFLRLMAKSWWCLSLKSAGASLEGSGITRRTVKKMYKTCKELLKIADLIYEGTNLDRADLMSTLMTIILWLIRKVTFDSVEDNERLVEEMAAAKTEIEDTFLPDSFCASEKKQLQGARRVTTLVRLERSVYLGYRQKMDGPTNMDDVD